MSCCSKPNGKPNGTCEKVLGPAEGEPHDSHHWTGHVPSPCPDLYMSSACCSVSAPEKKSSGYLQAEAPPTHRKARSKAKPFDRK